MKRRIVFILCVIAATAAACKKDSLNLYDRFSGRWELAYESSFWFDRAYPPGNGRIIVLTKNGRYERVSQDTVRFSGEYLLQNKKECFGDSIAVHLSTTDPTDLFKETTITLFNDSLIRYPPNCSADAPTYVYRRIR